MLLFVKNKTWNTVEKSFLNYNFQRWEFVLKRKKKFLYQYSTILVKTIEISILNTFFLLIKKNYGDFENELERSVQNKGLDFLIFTPSPPTSISKCTYVIKSLNDQHYSDSSYFKTEKMTFNTQFIKGKNIFSYSNNNFICNQPICPLVAWITKLNLDFMLNIMLLISVLNKIFEY